MILIQNGTQGPTTPPPKVAPVGTPGYANNTPGVTAPSRWDPDNANTIMAEIAAVITAAGIALDPTNNAQLLAAIRAIGFPTGLGTLTTSTTLTAAHAGTFYDLGGSGITTTLNTSTFTAGQTIGFLATSAATVTASSGSFYGGALSGSSIAMPAGSLVALQWDGANWRQLAGSFLATPHGEQSFTTSGSFTVPAGVYQASAEAWGGGGGGGGGSSAGGAVAVGGGGGEYRRGWFAVAPGQTITVTVGAGGNAAGGSGTGSNGGNSSFGSFLSAIGGAGGLGATSGVQTGASAGGTGGTGGDFDVPGGTAINGFACSPLSVSAPGGNSFCTAGAPGSTGSGSFGASPGGGAAGGANGNAGGNGGGGAVIVRW